MSYQFQMPKWEFSQFLTLSEELRELPLSQQEIVGLAYLKSCRDTVIKRGFSYLASFDGRHRSGKSIAAVTLGSLWDQTFYDNMETRIVQDHKEFADVLEGIDKRGLRGAVMMVDEAGTSMSSADWYENFMKAISKSVQVLGYLRPIILFVAPVKDFVDSRLRKMFHAYYKVERSNLQYSFLTPYNLKFNSIYRKTFYKKPVVKIMGETRVVSRIRLTAPPDIIKRYSELELNRKPEMMKQFYKDIRQQELKEQKQDFDFEKAVDYVVRNYAAFTTKRSTDNNIILDQDMIWVKLKITNRLAKMVKREAEAKIRNRLMQGDVNDMEGKTEKGSE